MALRGPVVRVLWRVVPVLILAVGGIGAFVLVESKPQLAPVAVAERVWTVKAQPASNIDVQPKIIFYGQVVAGREVELRPLVSGRVVVVNAKFENGGKVEAGDMLISIDPFDYEIAVEEVKAELSEAQARLSELASDLESNASMMVEDKSKQELRAKGAKRWTNLRRKGAASSTVADDAEMALLETNSRVIERGFDGQRLKANYQRQEAVIRGLDIKLRRAVRDLAETELIAPFTGYLTDIGTDLGRQVSQSDRVARLIDSSKLEVRFHVGTSRFGEVILGGEAIGKTVDIVWHVNGKPLTFTGKLTRISPEIDASSGGIEVYAELEQSDSLRLLRPGAFVEVKTAGQRYQNVVRLPESAWHNGIVYAITDGRLEPRKATLVRRIGQDVLIQGTFDNKEPILVTPIPGASGGMRVEVVANAPGEGA
jgi:multidrug resistance efflux pump